MSWYRKNPLFAAALGVCALFVLGELWFIYDRWAASRTAAAKVVQKQTELAAMREVAPPPTRETAVAVEADLERAQRALAAMQTALKGTGPTAERLRTVKVPAARTDAFFDLATFVERMRELARKQGVEIRPEAARFGFAQYANEGPDAERIEAVFQQRQVAQYLIEALLESKPRTLMAVKREPPETKKERQARVAAIRAAAEGTAPPDDTEPIEPPQIAEGSDLFLIDAGMSARVPGYVDALAFRLVFTGQTAALRNFLNRLAAFDLPIVVREIAVEPATSEETAAAAPVEEDIAITGEPADSAPSVVLSPEPATKAAKKATPPAKAAKKSVPRATPIVARPWSKFTVTVEYIDLVPASNPSEEAPAEAAPSGS